MKNNANNSEGSTGTELLPSEWIHGDRKITIPGSSKVLCVNFFTLERDGKIVATVPTTFDLTNVPHEHHAAVVSLIHSRGTQLILLSTARREAEEERLRAVERGEPVAVFGEWILQMASESLKKLAGLFGM